MPKRLKGRRPRRGGEGAGDPEVKAGERARGSGVLLLLVELH